MFHSYRGYRASSQSVLSTILVCRASIILRVAVYAVKPSNVTYRLQGWLPEKKSDFLLAVRCYKRTQPSYSNPGSSLNLPSKLCLPNRWRLCGNRQMTNGSLTSRWHLGVMPNLYGWHLGFGTGEAWGWIITDDSNNNNNNGLSPSFELHLCGCGAECTMMDTDNGAF